MVLLYFSADVAHLIRPKKYYQKVLDQNAKFAPNIMQIVSNSTLENWCKKGTNCKNKGAGTKMHKS